MQQEHSAEEKEHGQRMVQRVQLHMHEGALGRYRKGGRGSSQEPQNVPRSAQGSLSGIIYCKWVYFDI